MQKHIQITRQRLQNFASENNLGGKLYPMRAPVRLSSYAAPGRIPYAVAMQGNYQDIQIGGQFGPPWSTHWVRVDITIPEAWNGHEVHLLWDSSSEACVWRDGEPMQGLTGTSTGWSSWMLRREYPLTRKAAGGEMLSLYIEVACNGLFGLGGEQTTPNFIGLLRQAEIAVFDREAWGLLWDFRVIADIAEHLPANSPRGGQALYAANAMVNATNLDDRSTWSKARQIAKEFFDAHNGDGQHNISAIGHAHIDTAWLWPLAETRRKCLRTFSTAVRYMEDYPDYLFVCSQAQQLEWVKEMAPGLYEKIKERVKEERFVPAGGTWVEPDCNIPSGESLVRQFLFGQRFFRREFGHTCQEFWVPDVFGYPAALPQIMRLAGIDYFLTQKLSWNQINKLASHTFIWEGLDGSRVLTHFPPTDTYNANCSVKEILYHVSNFKDHERARESYLLFGLGDGGGGPTLPMLEQLKRMVDVDGLPRLQMRTPQAFFARCQAEAKKLTTWVGELYLEIHRGTFTSQAHIKRANRHSEFLLHDVEFLSAVAHATQGTPYPKTELDPLWKRVLTNQFHDILPGSSINEVYNDAQKHYQEVETTGAELREKAIRALVGEPATTGNWCAVNTLGVWRNEVVGLPAGTPSPQISANGQPLGVAIVPPYGYAIFTPHETTTQTVTISESAEGFVLENEHVRATLGRDGSLASLYDKRARKESIEPGKAGNRFVLFDDEPNNFDAWDVEVFHLEKRYEAGAARSARVTEHGPLRASVAFEYELSPDSRLEQTISLTATSPRLDFSTQVEWHERHKFLKAEFPLNIRAQNATYEIQFGHLQRPTHFNTTWDLARFEVCAQKWADLSEHGFGVALLNDCKYGYATHGNVMRLSLLRSPKSPDPEADMGQHAFRYALLPHPGTFQEVGVIEEGYRFNEELMVRATNLPAGETSFFQVEPRGVILETVKKAEDTDDLVLRLYEAYGSHNSARLTTTLPVASAMICNLLEDDGQAIEWTRDGLTLELRPFQIVTIKLKLR